jgi:ankyrin repeat protein
MKQRVIIWGKLAVVLAMAVPIMRGPGFPDWLTGRPSAQVRLFAAITTDDLAAFDQALADGAPPAARNESNALPLGAASDLGRLEMMRRLIAAGADVNAADDNGMTPLIMAARSGQVEAIEMLICCGADLSHRDSFNQTALEVAVGSEWPGAARALRSRPHHRTGERGTRTRT